jgi:cation diffusion facilitator CzcD-associated flavoprotein CzcO
MSAAAALPWCVVGAGPSGLTTLKNLRAAGIPAECLEREDDVGGNWYFGSAASAVFESTRLISSKRLTAYTDYPMPREWPAYPDHRRCLAYLRDYARHFGLRPHIRTNAAVARIEPHPAGGWLVTTTDGRASRHGGVAIASGHNRTPRMPDVPGGFAGRLLHASDYKSPTRPVPIAGRRVLVVGGGNSACDIAVECARHAALTVLSLRRGYHVVPRYILGRPADLRGERLLTLGLPLWLRRLVSLRAIDREIGLPARNGLPRPDHRLWETHPVVNGDLGGLVASGAVRPAADLVRYDGTGVVFADGRREEFDVVICATGYRVTLPFIDPGHVLADADGCPRLFHHLLHPGRDDMAVVGLIQPDSGQWWITDLQARLVARMALAARTAPAAAAWLYRQRQRPDPAPPVRYVDSPRHRLEVEHFSYAQGIRRLIAGMDRRLRRAAGRATSPAQGS